MAVVVEFTGKINSDLTVKFPFKYFRGNRYIMVVYDYDINAIIIEAIKSVKENQSPMHMKHYTTA